MLYSWSVTCWLGHLVSRLRAADSICSLQSAICEALLAHPVKRTAEIRSSMAQDGTVVPGQLQRMVSPAPHLSGIAHYSIRASLARYIRKQEVDDKMDKVQFDVCHHIMAAYLVIY